ncbi:hypothetical protein [Metallosphaera javensis (ex Sakai et al. 2022)]|uniref:hypothetical protein n=1 Tax=Metallosphaera javensis (ex Sakai et al. 2022) TaxID=2775498 RepID=UPI00258F47C1|nr:MAG: hypothetical protein MjAS7_1062 [Metallosphaera javensis (ex Sakai et al. 2022)]
MKIAYVVIIVVLVSIFALITVKQVDSMRTTPLGEGGQIYEVNNGLTTLYLVLNTTKINPGETIRITAMMFYDGNQPMLINATHSNLPSPYPCGDPLLVGLEVFRGYYTSSNVTDARPLLLYKPGPYFCPVIRVANQYRLMPLSDHMQLIFQGRVLENVSDEISLSLSGYWIATNSGTPFSGNFTTFQPGVYTVEAVDYFNQSLFGYFTVV